MRISVSLAWPGDAPVKASKGDDMDGKVLESGERALRQPSVARLRAEPLLLAGDIGGTKTVLALVRPDAPQAPVFERRYASQTYPGFDLLLDEFFAAAGKVNVARGVLAVAGPVEGNRSKLTYLPWIIEASALAAKFGLGRLQLVNDFAAAARGVKALPGDAFFTLQAGAPEAGAPAVVLGAGTGLGVAALLPERQGQWRVIPGEGGHIGFAAQDIEEDTLAEYLRRRHGRATAERVLSGPGLVDVYSWLRERAATAAGEDLALRPDAAAVITATALAHPLGLAGQALEVFVRCYGAFAGDLALLYFARGGVYLAGGIAPKMLPRLCDGSFLDAFHAKAEHADLMPAFPIQVVMDERVGVIGAAALAAQSVGL